MSETKSGCQTLKELWSIAINDLAIDDPSFKSSYKRSLAPIKLKNIKEFITIAAIKCAEEMS